MSAAFTDAEIDAIIADLKAQLAANHAAILKTQETQQHSMDTGQSRVMVMRQQLSQLRGERARIRAEIDEWCAQKSTASGGAYIGRPGY